MTRWVGEPEATQYKHGKSNPRVEGNQPTWKDPIAGIFPIFILDILIHYDIHLSCILRPIELAAIFIFNRTPL